MKKMRLLSLLLVLVMVMSLLPSAAFAVTADEDEYTVTISFEGLTIGQGFYIEPKTYTLSEINTILGTNYKGDGDLKAGMVTKALLTELGYEAELGSSGISAGGDWGNGGFYLSAVKFGKDMLDRPLHVNQALVDNGAPTAEEAAAEGRGNADWLGEFDYSFMSGWMITVDNVLIGQSAGAEPVNDGAVIRWRFTLWGYGADQGYNSSWGDAAYYTAANKDALYREYAAQAKAGTLTAEAKAAALEVMTRIDVTQADTDAACEALAKSAVPDEPGTQSQDVSAVLNEALDQMLVNTPVAQVGSIGGEWAVLALARSGKVALDSSYFANYYNNVVKYADDYDTDGSGKLHSRKSTDNSRVIIGLSAIGKDSTSVGAHDLTLPIREFDNVMDYVGWQGNNGTAYALIALDTNNYCNDTVRNALIDALLAGRAPDGNGWGISQGSAGTIDMTAMSAQALAPYYNKRADVKAALDQVINWLSSKQQADGSFLYGSGAASESSSQVICICTALGINPDTDPRFVKNGVSAVDDLLRYYNPATKMFRHVFGQYAGGEDTGNAMATEQACYALTAYQRMLNGQTGLYDMSDVFSGAGTDTPVDPDALTATLGLPQEVEGTAGTEFNAVVNISGWKNEDGYKLMDCIVTVPAELEVTGVTMGDRVSGGEVSYFLEETTGKLRIVYADLENNSDLAISGTDFPAEFFTIGFKIKEAIDVEKVQKLDIAITGMSLKLNSESENPASMYIVDIAGAKGSVKLVQGISYTAAPLYQGDDVDLIPTSKMAVCVTVTGLKTPAKLVFNNGSGSVTFRYSASISGKIGVTSYVALVDSGIKMEDFVDAKNYTLTKETASESVTFGDVNGDGVINAQDALASVDAWLRKNEEAPTDLDILRLNVNSDSRINTFDALGIVEYFVDGSEFAIVNRAAMLNSSAN